MELTEADNNTTYRAYKDEEVIFNAANVLDPADFKPISAEKKALIIDQKAAANVKMIDLKALGITEYGSIKCVGFNANRDKGQAPVLFVNDKMQTVARYPNADYVETGTVLDAGKTNSDQGWTMQVDATTKGRMKKWTASKDIWMFGYFMHDWAESNLPVKEFSAAAGTVTSGYNGHYGITEERRYYYYNLLEELDAPGEWYLDREEGVLYLYPSETMEKVEFVTFDSPVIYALNSKNVTIKNLKFEQGLDTAINAKNVDGFVIDNCDISGFTGYSVSISGANT
ncbi:MAG: right-handed parallel beta-helix repeat-containing protein, partial [Ruminococcaceae bacterium]|nr:right-handed parallel beta-helix repeat-containing protein [Oscillospiraceae bacterium]